MGEAVTRTTCPYCGVGCGIVASRDAAGQVAVVGDPEHPANLGRLCSKGAALAETISLEGRLLHPEIGGRRVSWAKALDTVARGFADTLAKHGPDSVALYVSGQLLTEDYYVANKLMKGFVGSGNIDTNSRLCMASSVAGHKRAFGADMVPGTYEDLEQADLVVLVGSNLAWCHPVLYQRLAAARERRGTKVVVIDPRRTATCEIADMHLAIAPGSDVALFNGLLVSLVGGNAKADSFVERHTAGFKAAFAAASTMPISRIARTTGLAQRTLYEFFDMFRRTERVVTVYSQGVNQSSAGTDKVNAIINCHLLTGRIGKPGMGPFSVTGQPNAMGGRETGGLANMLAAHMEIDNPAHREIVREFWGTPRLAEKPGLKAVDMFRAVEDGRIKALWIMATNPVATLPEADRVRAAVKACPLVVVSEVVRDTDTAALAHVLLPSLAWGEKDGTVTNSERRISRQRAFLPAPGKAKADWWQLAQVAKRLGYGEAFAWRHPAAIFAEYSALTAAGNDGTRDLDIGACARISRKGYDALAPFQWPWRAGSEPDDRRFFGEGKFFTPDGRARMVATPYRLPADAVTAERPLALNTGRVRDHWHTMTRTGRSARLSAHIAEPFVEMHPEDAAARGLETAALARLTSAHGTAVARVAISERQRRGSVFVPMHWTGTHASSGRVDALVAARLDPVSGQPELKHTPVEVEPFAVAWHGFAVSGARPETASLDYWALAQARGGWRVELAGLTDPDDWPGLLARLLPDARLEGAEILRYSDKAGGRHRFVVIDGDRLAAALYVSREPVAAARDYLSGLVGTAIPDAASRWRLLSGLPPADTPDPGPIVCACFEVGRNVIREAAAKGPCASVEAVGAATRAGTNCGSCRAEIGRIIHADRIARAG